jgi:hypothetical protein
MTPGTYDLTSGTSFASPDGGTSNQSSRRETVVVTGSGDSFTVQIAQRSGTTFRRQTGSLTMSGTNATFAPTCPPPGDGNDTGGTFGYSASGSTFTVFDMTGSGGTRVSVYTRRN